MQNGIQIKDYGRKEEMKINTRDESKFEEFSSIMARYDFLEKLYDKIRVVDPVANKVIYTVGNEVEEEDVSCYKFWGQNKMCDDCVSMRAYENEDTFVKIKYTKSQVYLVTSVPIKIKDRKLVIEMIKNITASLAIEGQLDEKSPEQIKTIAETLQSIVVKDGLTDLFNRRYIETNLPVEIQNARGAQKELTVIMTDIDDFKEINDTYGHPAGDKVIKKFSEIILKSIRRDFDWAARYGGEEFLICLVETNREQAMKVAERIRSTMEREVFESGGRTFKVTASFGLCTVGHTEEKSYLDVVNCADSFLLKAKSEGKNIVK
ncbi:GGDEF domain-containing protein [Alkalibacter mobilis]|uniref:GGDEF domain-containing protein n=1 Tax=Alkalibacter mobilis TaxID=2787712 RepID=UPI0018A022C4|nr:GGDEF domain-containing protein [Alkalibacter mobilis]MBF7096368.1 GGDEF domain-containing protein [Alkalibacter mobilis]